MTNLWWQSGKYCYPYLSKKEIKDPVRSCVLAEFRELIRNDNCTRTMNVWIGTGLIAHGWKQIEWEKNRTSDLIYFQAFKVQVSAEMWSAGSRGKNETIPGPPKFTARILKLGVLFRVFQKQTPIQGPNTNRPNARSLGGGVSKKIPARGWEIEKGREAMQKWAMHDKPITTVCYWILILLGNSLGTDAENALHSLLIQGLWVRGCCRD